MNDVTMYTVFYQTMPNSTYSTPTSTPTLKPTTC